MQDCIRTLWFHFLKHIGVKKSDEAPQSNDEPVAKKRKTTEETSGQENVTVQSTLDFDPDREINLDMSSTSDSSEELEDDDIFISSTGNKSKKQRLDSPYLSLMNCIALCYLGLLYAEETVLLVDMAR